MLPQAIYCTDGQWTLDGPLADGSYTATCSGPIQAGLDAASVDSFGQSLLSVVVALVLASVVWRTTRGRI